MKFYFFRCVLLVGLIWPSISFANSPAWDPNFGNLGAIFLWNQYLGPAQAIAPFPDGGFLALRQIRDRWELNQPVNRVWKYLANGTPDLSFGQNAMIDTGLRDETLSDINLNWLRVVEGGFIVAGTRSNWGAAGEFIIKKFRGNGEVDDKFGEGGLVTKAVPINAKLGSAIVDGEGSIYLAATAELDSRRLIIDRFMANGAVDSSFHGEYYFDPKDYPDLNNGRLGILKEFTPKKLQVLKDGSILVLGEWYVFRFLKSGERDLKFELVGGDLSMAQTMYADESGIFVGTPSRLYRYGMDGKLDKSFGVDGVWGLGHVSEISRTPDGGVILSVGRWKNRQGTEFYFVKLTAQGQVDTSYGNKGWLFAGTTALKEDVPGSNENDMDDDFARQTFFSRHNPYYKNEFLLQPDGGLILALHHHMVAWGINVWRTGVFKYSWK